MLEIGIEQFLSAGITAESKVKNFFADEYFSTRT